MDFGFSEEQQFLRSTAREFLASECPPARVRELMEDERGFDPELWARMAELGWLGLLVPEEHGGVGLGLVDLVVVLEELGRALVPSPLFGHLQGTLALLRAGSETQQKELLPPAARGERILSLAITEEAGTEEAHDLVVAASPDGDAVRLSGTKLFVPDAAAADTIVVVARGESGFSLLLVDREQSGVAVTPHASIDRTRRLAEVRFDGARGERLGDEGSAWAAWEWVRDRALVALAAEAVGGAGKVLEDAVAHALDRVQFGRPIGVHQAIKHRCADLLALVEASKSLTYYAAWAADQELSDAPLAAAMAKAWTADAYRRATADNIQIHGGVGFTWEYDCHLYFKRAKALEVTYGDAARHRERVARFMEL